MKTLHITGIVSWEAKVVLRPEVLLLRLPHASLERTLAGDLCDRVVDYVLTNRTSNFAVIPLPRISVPVALPFLNNKGPVNVLSSAQLRFNITYQL